MFKELCGQKTLTNVLVVTTNWGRVGEAEGKRREKALAAGFFKSLLDQGACMVRHDNTAKCARSILSPLLYKAGVTTKIQDELVSGTALAQTSAGVVVDTNIKAAEARHRKKIQNLKEQLEKAALAKDEKLQKELELERRAVVSKLGNLDVERRRLEETIEKQRREMEMQLGKLEKAKAEADRKAKEMEAAQKQVEAHAAEQQRKIREELEKAKENAERREMNMKAAAEKERKEQNNRISAQLAKEEEEANRKAKEMEVAQERLKAEAAVEQRKLAEQLAETKRDAKRRQAAMTAVTEKERQEFLQLIDAQLEEVQEEADRKTREVVAMQMKLDAAAAEQRAESQRELERARQAARLQEETAEKERQKQRWDAAELFAKQKEDADRKLAVMAAEAERKRQEVQRQLMHAQQETKRIEQDLAQAREKADRRGFLKKALHSKSGRR